jgi:uncharacterized protein YjbI with pentapeptide repeats
MEFLPDLEAGAQDLEEGFGEAGNPPQGPDFSNSVHMGIDLGGRNLTGADFRNADMTGCDFTGARLEGADFTGACLLGAILPPDLENLRGITLRDTIAPDGTVLGSTGRWSRLELEALKIACRILGYPPRG